MKTQEIAARISKHLKRFEADSTINVKQDVRIDRPYYNATVTAGNGVYVTYISYQGSTRLTRDEAAAYLAWLDAGNVGTHRCCPAVLDLQEKAKQAKQAKQVIKNTAAVEQRQVRHDAFLKEVRTAIQCALPASPDVDPDAVMTVLFDLGVLSRKPTVL